MTESEIRYVMAAYYKTLQYNDAQYGNRWRGRASALQGVQGCQYKLDQIRKARMHAVKPSAVGMSSETDKPELEAQETEGPG